SGAGTLQLGGGTLSRAAGSVVNITGGLTGTGGSADFGSGDTISGAITLQSGSGTVNFHAALSGPSVPSLSVLASDTLNLNPGLVLPSLGAVTVGDNGNSTTNFNTGSALTLASLAVQGGSAGTTRLIGGDNLTVTGATTWVAGGSGGQVIGGS